MWTIQKDIFGEEETKLCDTLSGLGISFNLCKDPRDYVFSKSESFYVPRGSVDFVSTAQSKGWEKVVTLENYDCTNYYQKWLPNLLNNVHFFVPWGILRQKGYQYFNWLSCDELFIRPNSGRKIFTGNYITKKWFKKDLESIRTLPGNNPTDSTLVLVAPKKPITIEYRLVMYKEECISCSVYQNEDLWPQESVDIHAVNAVDYGKDCAFYLPKVFDNPYPDDYYTIDIGLNETNTPFIIELNSLFSAGWYDCDYEKIVKHIEKTFGEKYER